MPVATISQLEKQVPFKFLDLDDAPFSKSTYRHSLVVFSPSSLIFFLGDPEGSGKLWS